MRKILVALFMVGGSACGALPGFGAAGSESCNLPAIKQCQDDLNQSALTLASVKSACPMNKGVFSSGLCSRTGSIGGCKLDESALMAGASIVTWYFPGAVVGGKTLNTAADVMTACGPASGDSTFQAP